MTDTSTTAAPRTRDAKYELEVVDALPPKAPRTSALKQKVAEIRNNEKYHKQPIRIAHYGSGPTASAAANTLRNHFGNKPYVEGFKFETRRFTHDEHGDRTGLFVIYDPEAKQEDGWAKMKEEKEKRAKARADGIAKRAAEKAQASGKPDANASAAQAQNTPKQVKK